MSEKALPNHRLLPNRVRVQWQLNPKRRSLPRFAFNLDVRAVKVEDLAYY